MSVVSNALEVMHEATRELSGVSIRIRHGNEDCELIANPGATVSEDYGDTGEVITARLQDWIVDPDKLRIGGLLFRPDRGDRITVVSDSRQFKIVPGVGERYWRWSDHTNTAIRIHSVEEKKTTE